MSEVTSTSAYTELVSQALPRLYGMARRIAGADAEDLVQETRAFHQDQRCVELKVLKIAPGGSTHTTPTSIRMTRS